MRTLSRAAQAAKLIRKELKVNFPKVKFSVVSDNYSMGCSVTVYFDRELNLEYKELYKITDKYQRGHFDGMTDSYQITNKRTDLPLVDHVLLQCR